MNFVTEMTTHLSSESEYFALSSGPEAKNLFVEGVSLKGPMDEDAMKRAVNMALDVFPQFASRLREQRKKGVYRLSLETNPHWKPELKVTPMDISNESAPLLESVLRHLSPTLEEDWDPVGKAPVELYLVRIHKEYHLFCAFIHHLAADVWSILHFFREVLGHYHAMVTGHRPSWEAQSFVTSALKNEMVPYRNRHWKNFINGLCLLRMWLVEKPGGPVGTGDATRKTDHNIQRILPAVETAKLVKASSRMGVSITDRLACAGNMAIAKWDAAHKVPPQPINTCISVQMRGRSGLYSAPVNVSALFFRSEAQERKNPRLFLISMAKKRINKFDENEDLTFRMTTAGLINALGVFPFRTKRRLIRLFANKRIFSMMIANRGVLWPELEGGKLTGNSYLSRAGELEVSELHAFAQGMAFFSNLYLSAYTFRNRLNLVLNARAVLFTRAEIEALMSLLVENLLDNLDSVD